MFDDVLFVSIEQLNVFPLTIHFSTLSKSMAQLRFNFLLKERNAQLNILNDILHKTQMTSIKRSQPLMMARIN